MNKAGPVEQREVPSAALAEYTGDELNAGAKLFRQPCEFVKGVVKVDDLPADRLPEVCFAGRSNVGKSSLLNALVNRKSLARTSNTPGRTREVNYFLLAKQIYLVDLPGYGYARASKSEIKGWTKLVHDYLKGRAELKRVYLLIDSRHGLKDKDRVILKLLDGSAVSYQVVLTKIDKIKPHQLHKVAEITAKELSKHPASYPGIIATSARLGDGIDDLRAAIASFV